MLAACLFFIGVQALSVTILARVLPHSLGSVILYDFIIFLMMRLA